MYLYMFDLFLLVPVNNFSVMSGQACADPGIFVRGGPGDKKGLTFFFFFLVLS